MENYIPDSLKTENKHELDESIWETIVKDLKLIAAKTRYAILPFSSADKVEAMRDCSPEITKGTFGDHSSFVWQWRCS